MIIDATLSNPASSSVSATDVAAWIGAITGVGLLFWNIYTWWHSGPRLRVEALPNLFPGDLPVAPIPENRSFLQIKVYNYGDRETTPNQASLNLLSHSLVSGVATPSGRLTRFRFSLLS